jgi:hypothetical protein
MTIVRCKKCRIVVLDSSQDGEREVQCMECDRRYRIKLEDGDVVTYDLLDSPEKKSSEVTHG